MGSTVMSLYSQNNRPEPSMGSLRPPFRPWLALLVALQLVRGAASFMRYKCRPRMMFAAGEGEEIDYTKLAPGVVSTHDAFTMSMVVGVLSQRGGKHCQTKAAMRVRVYPPAGALRLARDVRRHTVRGVAEPGHAQGQARPHRPACRGDGHQLHAAGVCVCVCAHGLAARGLKRLPPLSLQMAVRTSMRIRTVAAGRTDKGVHARGQVCVCVCVYASSRP